MDTLLTIEALASYLPSKEVPAEYFTQFAESDELVDHVMFKAPAMRHHAAAEELSVDMMIAAVAELRQHNVDVLDEVDVVLTHSQIPDIPIVGCGGDVARRLGIAPTTIVDVHNGGCASFILMMELARSLLLSTRGRKALICNATNAAGTIFTQDQVRSLAQAAIPGDGASAAVVALPDGVSGAQVDGILCRNYPQFAGDMTAVSDPERKYWEAGTGQMRVGFTESKLTKVLARGNRLVPEVALACMGAGLLRSGDVDCLITNQPNRVFLRNWREALELPPEKHVDTFELCGNLFGVGIPHNLRYAVDSGRVRAGDRVVLAAFAHAGDFAASATVRWGA